MAPISEQVPEVNDDEAGSDSELNQLNRSALRAASILISVGEHPDGASAAQLALETGVPRPTTFRILLSLVHTGLLARDGGTFKLGWRTAQLGRLADPYRDILPRVQVILDSLAAEVNESVEFVMFTSPTTQETIAQASSSRLLAPSQQYVGRSFPLHATATGKLLLSALDDDQLRAFLPERLEVVTPVTITDRQALLAELDTARSQGFATLDGELEEGLFVVAVPVRNAAGKLISGLAASGLSQRMKSMDIGFYVEKLHAAAAKLGTVVSPS
ncbi:IclR family transcriptional regulator [Arthrobacter sp. NPDC056493]|uniref:IclR family transcriptional regulator n=1 Tax=Arthrobacter sp. NPDC056493 TaxID=3345839 RepID=UPI00367070C4